MPSVFLSYRRSDAAGHAGRLYDGLVARFGQGSVFMDLDSIGPGIDWVDRIDQAVDASDVMLAVIGSHWLTESNPDGTRRLEDPSDFVRKELAAALEHGLPVVPVLVGGAKMPPGEVLPADLTPLARRNAFELSDGRWRSDLDRLVGTISEMARHKGPAAEPGASPPTTAPALSDHVASTIATSRSRASGSEPRSSVIRFTRLSDWGTALRVAAPVGAAAVAVILATGVLTSSTNHSAPHSGTVLHFAPQPTTATPSAPNPSVGGVGPQGLTLYGWRPHTSAWTVVLASTSSRGAAAQVAGRAAANGRTGVLDSSRYSSLAPGRWLAFSGRYPTRAAAAAAAARWQREGFAGATPRFVNGAG